MKREEAVAELRWLFFDAEAEHGVKSNFNAMIRCLGEGSRRTRVEDGETVNGVAEDLFNEDTMIFALDARRARSRLAAASKGRVILAAYQRVHAKHQRHLELAFEARQIPPQVREALGEAALLAPHTVAARSRRWDWSAFAGALASKRPWAGQVKAQAEKMLVDALDAYWRARSVTA